MAAKSRPREPLPTQSSAPAFTRLSSTRLFRNFGFDGLTEPEKTVEASGGGACFADGFGSVFADILDGGEAKQISNCWLWAR